MNCPLCHAPVKPEEKGGYKLITGWVKVRAEGGGHAIEMPSPPTAFAHGHCITLAKVRLKTGGSHQHTLDL